MIKFADMFQDKSLDFTGGVDVVDVFNTVVGGINAIEEEEETGNKYLDIVNRAQEEQQERFKDILEEPEPKPFELNPEPMDFGDRSKAVVEDQSPASSTSRSTIPAKRFNLPVVTDGSVRALDVTRDQIKNLNSRPGARIFSQDFNDADSKSARGIEIKVPKDATPQEIAAAKAWAKRTQQTYKQLGVIVPLRGDEGIKRDGRGVSGFFHMEDHFKFNKAARDAIKNNPQAFAQVTADTLGRLPGSTFINPHKTTDPGAIGPDKIGEVEFSRRYRTPFLQKALGRK